MDTSKLSQVIKVVDPQADFRPIKYSDLQEKVMCDKSGAILKLFTDYLKTAKQEEIRKCAENWCLK